MPSKRQSIRKWAHDFFLKVSYVDVYGRNVGYDYDYILAELKKQFPEAKTSKRWLRMMAYELSGTVRMPARLRYKGLAEGYAMALLVSTPQDISYVGIVARITKKFPAYSPSLITLHHLENKLRHEKFVVPHRAA